MVTTAKNAGAFPVIVTPIARNDGTLAEQHIDTNGTHTNEAGALNYSSLLVQGIKEANLQPLVTFLR